MQRTHPEADMHKRVGSRSPSPPSPPSPDSSDPTTTHDATGQADANPDQEEARPGWWESTWGSVTSTYSALSRRASETATSVRGYCERTYNSAKNTIANTQRIVWRYTSVVTQRTAARLYRRRALNAAGDATNLLGAIFYSHSSATTQAVVNTLTDAIGVTTAQDTFGTVMHETQQRSAQQQLRVLSGDDSKSDDRVNQLTQTEQAQRFSVVGLKAYATYAAVMTLHPSLQDSALGHWRVPMTVLGALPSLIATAYTVRLEQGHFEGDWERARNATTRNIRDILTRERAQLRTEQRTRPNTHLPSAGSTFIAQHTSAGMRVGRVDQLPRAQERMAAERETAVPTRGQLWLSFCTVAQNSMQAVNNITYGMEYVPDGFRYNQLFSFVATTILSANLVLETPHISSQTHAQHYARAQQALVAIYAYYLVSTAMAVSGNDDAIPHQQVGVFAMNIGSVLTQMVASQAFHEQLRDFSGQLSAVLGWARATVSSGCQRYGSPSSQHFILTQLSGACDGIYQRMRAFFSQESQERLFVLNKKDGQYAELDEAARHALTEAREFFDREEFGSAAEVLELRQSGDTAPHSTLN